MTTKLERPADTRDRQPARPRPVPPMQTDRGLASYQAEVKRHEGVDKVAIKWTVGFALVLFAATGVMLLVCSDGQYWIDPMLGLVSGGVALLCAGRFWRDLRRHVWAEAEYYLVDGSRDLDGRHQCIWCGGRGVHRRTEYKTTHVVAKCTSCGQGLWG